VSEFELERNDVLPYEETAFDEKVRSVVSRMFRDPGSLPEEFRGWLPFFIEQSNVQVPKTQVIGFAAAEVPVGSIVLYGVATAPTGWILCDGSAVSRSDQALLFAVIGTTYGVGDGSSTFNVPDLRGRVPVGRDSGQTEFDAMAETGGAKTHTLTTAELASHNHGGVSGDYMLTDGSAVGGVIGAGFTTYVGQSKSGVTASSGSGASHNNLQPYLIVNFIIKAV